jgi:hypothetical protein
MSVSQNGKRKGMPPYVPSEEEREFVYLMCAVGYSHTRIVDYLSNKRGGKLGLRTFHRHFKKEIALSQTGVDKMVYRSLVAAAKRGERWAVQLWLEQRCHPLDRGAWRCRPDTAVMVGVQTQNEDRVVMNVMFETPDLAAKPWLKKPSIMDLAAIDSPPRRLPDDGSATGRPADDGSATEKPADDEPLSFDGDVRYESGGASVEPVRKLSVGTKRVEPDRGHLSHVDGRPMADHQPYKTKTSWMS